MVDGDKPVGRMPDGKEIHIARRVGAMDYRRELATILNIIGHPEAFITDLSSLDNFAFEEDELAQITSRISAEFGIDRPKPDECLIDIAKRARQVREGN